MERTYIPDLLRTLTPEEQKEMELFLSSPYFNRGKYREAVPRLFQLMLREVSGDAMAQSRKDIYAQIFSGMPWVEGKLDKVLVDLKKLIQTFLQVQSYLRIDEASKRQLDMSKILRVRGLTTRSGMVLDKMRREQDKKLWRNSDYFLESFLLEEERYHQAAYSNQMKGDLNIPQTLLNLDVFFHFKRLELLNYFLLQQKLTGIEMSEPILRALNQSRIPEDYLHISAALLILNKIFDLLRLKQITPSQYQEILLLLQQNEVAIDPEQLKEFYTYLRNFCTMLVMANPDSEFSETLHLLHRNNLERGYLFGDSENKLLRSTFLNIVVIALKVRQFEWLHLFLEEYKFRIIGDNETFDLYRSGMANYLFALKKYAQSLDFIPASSHYVDYHLLGRRLELKIYYETESDLLIYKLNAFKMYISRASKKFLSDALRRRHLNFANFLSQVIFSKPGDKNRVERLRQRIEKEKWVADREWLLEKVQQLSAKRTEM